MESNGKQKQRNRGRLEKTLKPTLNIIILNYNKWEDGFLAMKTPEYKQSKKISLIVLMTFWFNMTNIAAKTEKKTKTYPD
jgi:hypothetical protein